MSKDKLVEMRKKAAEAKAKQRKELVDAQSEVKNAISELGEIISGQAFDWGKFKEHIDSLKNSVTFKEDVQRLQDALNSIHNDALKTESIDKLVQTIESNGSKEVVNAVKALTVTLEANTVSQSAEDFQPVRRVVKVGNKLIFDDLPTPFNSGGGGGSGGGGIQTSLTRNGVTSISVVNPDGTPIAGGGGGGGDASAANQVTQIDLLEEIRDNTADIEVSVGDVDVNTDALESKVDATNTKLDTIASQQQQDGLTNTELRATPVPVSGTVTTGGLTDSQLRASAVPISISSGNITGYATSTKQDDLATLTGAVNETAPATDTASSGLNGRMQRMSQRLTSLIALLPGSLGQKARAASLAVTLSSEDITALTPPSAITGFATSAKQDSLLTELQLKADLTETQPVSLASVPSHAVTNVGTFAVQAASAGDVAHDAVDSGNPQKVGGYAKATAPTAVADGDRVNAWFSPNGAQYVADATANQKLAPTITTITASTAETTVLAQIASTYQDVYGATFTNTSATATKVTLRDDTAGTPRWSCMVPAGDSRGFMVHPSGAMPQTASNKNWSVTCGTSVTSLEVTLFAVKRT